MRVAITHPYSWPSVRRGAERIIMETARALAGRSHEVTIFTSGAGPRRERRDGYRVVRFRRIFDDPHRHERWFGWRVAPALAARRFDVVHSVMPHDCLAAIRTQRLRGHRTVYDEMGIPELSHWGRRPDKWARELVVEHVDVYGCMSQFALDSLAREFGRSGVLIPGGVRLSEFQPADRREQRPTILFSGKLDETRKGVHILLEALAILRQSMPDAQVWLSGPGDVTPILQAAPGAAREATVVLPLGTPDEQAERYARAWVTTLPSVNESFGMVLLESLACGTPIVVTDHAAPQELVRPGAGVVCAARDPESLAEALREGVEQARDPKTAERCRSVAAAYDWDEGLAPQLERLYTMALDEQSAARS